MLIQFEKFLAVTLSFAIIICALGCGVDATEKKGGIVISDAARVESGQTSLIREHHEKININTATAEQLSRVPHIGLAVGEKIVDHRKQFGPFRKVEHLMVIDGMSDARFRRIHHLVTID